MEKGVNIVGGKLKSRKFWMAVVTALLVILNQGFNLGIPEEAVKQVVTVIISYILGESAVDAVGTLKKSGQDGINNAA
jgi:uncharacterized membrane protein